MRENASLLKCFSDNFVSINRCLDFFLVRRQTSCMILELSGYPEYFIFFYFFNEDISNALTIFFIRCGISAIKKIGSSVIG